jgi:hypothetical protein
MKSASLPALPLCSTTLRVAVFPPYLLPKVGIAWNLLERFGLFWIVLDFMQASL